MSIGASLIFKNHPFYTALLIFTFGIVLSSCNEPLEVKDFDATSWKSDKKACNNTRIQYEDVLMSAREQIVGTSQEDIIRFLGRPERQELYTRGQKFYIYYLSPAEECADHINSTAPPRLLYVRFSALNKVNEIFVQQL